MGRLYFYFAKEGRLRTFGVLGEGRFIRRFLFSTRFFDPEVIVHRSFVKQMIALVLKEDDGIWAEKPGVYMSRKTSCNGTTNPAASVWTSGSVPYNSKIIYYRIRDDRTINW